MSKTGPIIIIEDDIDDKDIFISVLSELNVSNEIIWFECCDEALAYLDITSEPVFIIFSDINLPRKSGFELKYEIDLDARIKKKCIPFVFYSTSTQQEDIDTAFNKLGVQGYFKKGTDYHQIKNEIKTIIDYWKISGQPT